HNHGIVISSTPLPEAVFPHDFDCNEAAKALRGPVPDVDGGYEGPATIETYTLFYKRDGSVRVGTVVGLTPEGKRLLATVPAQDEAMIDFLTNGKTEPVGSPGQVRRRDDGMLQWSAA
ncbi:MAG: hypothetical protein RIQ28_965, partial [Pseudomonadota bacterium]